MKVLLSFLSIIILAAGVQEGCKVKQIPQDDLNTDSGFGINHTDTEEVQSLSARTTASADETLVGVYFMPSWNVSPDPSKDVDSFWPCLYKPEDCAFTKNTGMWGPRGRIFNKANPYEGPFLDRKPHNSLGGFYKRDDPKVAKKQLEMMKGYGIDFFAYNWFFGRHYYYHLGFAPQAKTYYPKGWKVDNSNYKRVAVPGIEQWEDQLTVLLKENEKLPEAKQMKWALNWCDDSDENWMLWLDVGSPASLAAKRNVGNEKPNKELYLQVHDKITMLWIDKYFKRSDYLKDPIGRPIVYYYFPHDTESRASFYGVSLKELLDRSKALARNAGHPGIKFIAVTSGAMTEIERPYAMPTKWVANNPREPWRGGRYTNKLLFQDYAKRLKGLGFEGMTAYIYHTYGNQANWSFADMRKNYRSHWQKWTNEYKDDPNFEYHPPVAMGWDMRPMGGTWPQQTGFPSEPGKDKVHSNKSTFKAKLEEARLTAEKYKATNGNTVMICCWNEYLEGNHIEPTEGHKFDYLEAIREVFSKK